MTAMISECEDRCIGHCCRIFRLDYSYRDLFEKAAVLTDGEQIRDMVMPMYWESTGTDPDTLQYSCKNQLPNGDCAIYDNRPKMCRDYPYEGECIHASCTFRKKLDEGTSSEPEVHQDP